MKSLKEKISVMQAALDGKEIEIKYLTHDKDFKIPTNGIEWNWQIADYRIKPTPMEFWVNVYDRYAYLHDSEEEARNKKETGVEVKTIKVREVTDD